MSVRRLRRARRWLPHLADRYLVELLTSAVNDRDQSSRDEHCAEHRGHDAQAMHDREAAHRTGAEDQQGNAGDQRGDIRIENRVPGAFVTGLDRGMRGVAPAELLSD